MRSQIQEQGFDVFISCKSEDYALARDLYDTVEIGEVIPQKYWTALSIILAEIYNMKKKV